MTMSRSWVSVAVGTLVGVLLVGVVILPGLDLTGDTHVECQTGTALGNVTAWNPAAAVAAPVSGC